MKTKNVLRSLCITAGFALLAAPHLARAQSNVEIYGLVGLYAGSMQRSDSPARTTQEGHGGLTTSYLGFRGKEDLGGGLKAIFQLENFFQPDTGASGRSAADPVGFSRSSWVGLEGDFGRVTMGRHTTQYYLAMQAVNPFQASTVFSPLVLHSYVATFGGTLSGDSVWDNTIQYSTPNIGGLTASVQHAFGEVAGSNSIDNNGLNVRYVNGPLSATFAAQRVKVAKVAPSTSQTAYLAGGTYDFGVVKVFASAQATDRNITDLKSKTYQLGASVPVTPSSNILMSWAQTKIEKPATSDIKRNTAAIGYDYFLSKRTDVYAIYLYDKLTAYSVGNSYALGIRHTF